MRVMPQFRKEPALKVSTPEVRHIKAGCYSSIDDIMGAIMKNATRNDKEKLSLSWKVDRATHELQITFCGNV